jgi:sugar lactone lactonase YvrE
MIDIFETRFAPVAQGMGALEWLCIGAIWSAKPVWMAKDNALRWRDISNNRLLRWTQLIFTFVAAQQIIGGLAAGGVKR